MSRHSQFLWPVAVTRVAVCSQSEATRSSGALAVSPDKRRTLCLLAWFRENAVRPLKQAYLRRGNPIAILSQRSLSLFRDAVKMCLGPQNQHFVGYRGRSHEAGTQTVGCQSPVTRGVGGEDVAKSLFLFEAKDSLADEDR